MFSKSLTVILLPIKRCIPPDTPMDAMETKMVTTEITVDEVPIIAGLVIFEIMSQYIYPENSIVIDSI